MPFWNIILIPLNIATRTVCVTLILEALLLLGNLIKKITNVQFKRETCHASLGLIWTGVTFNSFRQLLLKPWWVNLEFRTLQWTISSHDPPRRNYLPVSTLVLTFTIFCYLIFFKFLFLWKTFFFYPHPRPTPTTHDRPTTHDIYLHSLLLTAERRGRQNVL